MRYRAFGMQRVGNWKSAKAAALGTLTQRAVTDLGQLLPCSPCWARHLRIDVGVNNLDRKRRDALRLAARVFRPARAHPW